MVRRDDGSPKHTRVTSHSGFTLIELLVVIAIIGILAAMLFPVFARARESARKTQCLANVKNIAMAIQIYLTDYDALFPTEHRTEVLNFLTDNGCGSDSMSNYPNGIAGWLVYASNPYLKEPVLLDEYTKSREVWRCPSAKVNGTPTGIFPDPDWFRWAQNYSDVFVAQMCSPWYPNGWGGSITDSGTQGYVDSGSSGAFSQSVGVNRNMHDIKASAIQEPSAYVACGDAGASLGDLSQVGGFAFPDTCGARCTSIWCLTHKDNFGGPFSAGDLTIGGQIPNRSNPPYPYVNDLVDPAKRKNYGRHMGGNNIGYLDGHASWVPVDRFIDDNMTQYYNGSGVDTTVYGGVHGLDGVFPNHICAQDYPSNAGSGPWIW
jgi:prepilin-type N-terminal cleavage/methylation domain-containing protein/prepilin-type processing-associated H-X9-DG protein